MMQSCGNLSADSDSVEGSSYADISEPTLKNYLYERYLNIFRKSNMSYKNVVDTKIAQLVKIIDKNFTIKKLLKNLQLMDSKEQLTLSGLLLLSKRIQQYRPVFTIKCVSFVGNSIGGTNFRDKMRDNDVEGNLLAQYEGAISFITRNLRSIQVEKDFNTHGQLEVPIAVFVELLTNAFIHRDYYINSPIRLFIFDDRIEIHSPGILPDGVTEDIIKQGISVPRNKLLFENAKYILTYTGIGSGIIRALQSYKNINFKNNFVTEEFVITILRETADKDAINGIVNHENDIVKHESGIVNHENGVVNINIEGVGEKINRDLTVMYSIIRDTPYIKISSIMTLTKKSNRTVSRYIKLLKDNNYIEFVGSDKTGGYRIK
jgi:predicted HTH transcriptional regulator